jgi:hypothetical protein
MSKRRKLNRASALALAAAVIGGLMQLSAHAAAPGTVTMQDANGDGFLVASELAAEPRVTWTHTDAAAATAKGWFENSDHTIPGACGPFDFAATIDDSLNGYLNAACGDALNENVVSWVVEWFDASAVSLGTASVSLTKDVVAPVAPTITTSPGVVTQASVAAVSVRVQSADPGTVALTFDDTDTTTPAVARSAAVTGDSTIAGTDLSSLVDGAITVTAILTDGAGLVSTAASQSVQKDTTAPATPVILTPGASDPPHSQYVSLTGTGQPNTTLKIFDGADVLEPSVTVGADGRWSKNERFGSSTHAVAVQAFDTLGNLSAKSAVRQFDVDATSPTVSIDNANYTPYAPTDAIVIAGRATDAGLSTSKVLAVKITLYDARGVSINCFDTSGHVCVPITPNVPPTVPTIRVGKDLTPGAEATCAACKNAADVTWSYDVPPSLPPGYYTLTAMSVDLANNGSLSQSIDFIKL